jgi:hypothetical protein
MQHTATRQAITAGAIVTLDASDTWGDAACNFPVFSVSGSTGAEAQ